MELLYTGDVGFKDLEFMLFDNANELFGPDLHDPGNVHLLQILKYAKVRDQGLITCMFTCPSMDEKVMKQIEEHFLVPIGSWSSIIRSL